MAGVAAAGACCRRACAPQASGTVVKLLAENGKPVTPGQALLILKP